MTGDLALRPRRPTPAAAPTWLLGLLALLAACLPGARAPAVQAERSLELGREPPAASPASAFAVVFGAPQGQTADPSEVSLLFNRPMRALEVAGEGETAPPARIVVRGTDTVPKGAWRWMGTSAIVFLPDPRLALATEYAVTVPAGTRSLGGDVLAAPYEMTFATPRPRVVSLDPSDREDLVPSQTFTARFDQPLDPREVARATALTAGGRRVPIVVTRPDPSKPEIVKIAPSAPLPLASKVVVLFDASLRGVAGPLPIGEPRAFEMSTFGPLEVKSVGCFQSANRRCQAGESVNVELSNAVAYGELRKHARITPEPPIRWSTTRDGAEPQSDFYLPAALRAGVTYHVTITAGLVDVHGQTLAQDRDATLTVDDLPRSVIVGLNGSVLDAASVRGRSIPVTAVNAPSYDLVTGALDEAQVAQVEAARRSSWHEAWNLVQSLPGLRTQTVTPAAPRNASITHPVAIEPLLAGRGGRGAIVVATADELKTASVTDLAITAKMSRFGSLVWVTRLSDGKPVAGATVAVRDAADVAFEGLTDADGLVGVPADRFTPADATGTLDPSRIVVARLGNDWTWKPVNDVLRWGWSNGVYVDAAGGLAAQGMLFSDRGVYRPGEAVELEAIFRRPTARGTETPAGAALAFTARDGQGEVVYEGPATLDDFGVATLHLPVPATAHLGALTIAAQLGGSSGPTATASVQLAAYKASEFKVGVDAPASGVVHGEQARFDVRGDYLFGAPMAGAPVRWTATRGRASFTPPGAEGFAVDDEAFGGDVAERAPRAGELQSGKGALDAHGALAVPVGVALAGQRGTETVTFEAEVADVSRQTVAAHGTTLVHPAAFYVGLRRPADWFIAKGDTARVAVVAVEPGGRRRAGARVHVDLVRRTWTSVLESTGESSGHWQSRAVDVIVGACDVVTTADEATCPLTPAESGFYLVHARARDDQGRTASASYDFYSVGAGGAGGWAQDDGPELSLVPDKKAYEVGDVARVLVKSPYADADALVTVERAGVVQQQRVTLTGATPVVKVAITEDMRPNVFVSVHLVHGRTKAAPARGVDAGAPSFKSGYARLTVAPESQRLKVALTPAKNEMRPGQTVEADVAVTDAAGKPVPSELTLWAVDEGVLMLTGYETPDPIPTFSAPRELAVVSLETRSEMATLFRATAGQLGVDKGDEGGGGGQPMRADFRATAWFQPGVKTDAGGRAHVRFKLPDNLTTFRVMAVAAARDDRFGRGEAQVTSSRPLMLRPALPRFLRAGDAIDAGVVVSTKGLPDTRVEVSAAAQGADLGGDAKRTVDVKSGQSVEVRWPIAAPHVGDAKLSFTARAGGEADAVQVTRAVQSPASLETVALTGETTGAVAEKIGDLGEVRDDVGRLDLRLASTGLLGVGDGLDQLMEYPYGCTEQLTSRLVPLVAARDLARAFGVALPGDPDALADAAVAKIIVNQRSNGGYGWWPDSRESDPWVTAYALWGLDVARRGGRPVPPEAIDRAVAYLRARLAQLSGASPVDLAGDALAADVLAQIGSPDPGFTNRLYERRKDMPLFARALLAHAIARQGMDGAQARELLADLESHLRLTPEEAVVTDKPSWDYVSVLDSTPRTGAIVLRALLAMDPKHPLAARLARGLLGEREHGAWSSTQEASWALLALDDYRRAEEARGTSFDARVWVGSDLALQVPFRDRKAIARDETVPMARVLGLGAPTVTFEVQGSGHLFYEARLRYARKDMPTGDLDRGFFVRKLVRAVTPEGLHDAVATLPAAGASRVRAGDLVLVDLIVTTPDPRTQVVVDDPLPAGLEPVDASLSTTAASLDVDRAAAQDDDAEGDDADERRGAGWPAWQPRVHREMRDDRVLTFVEHMPAGVYHYRYLARATTAGRFVVPPTRAECMYDPALFGRTAGTQFEVVAP